MLSGLVATQEWKAATPPHLRKAHNQQAGLPSSEKSKQAGLWSDTRFKSGFCLQLAV